MRHKIQTGEFNPVKVETPVEDSKSVTIEENK